MSKKLISVIRIVTFLGIGVLLLWLVLRQQDVSILKSNLESAHWGYALLALFFGLLSNIFRALRWNMLIEPLGYSPRLVNTFGSVMVGYMANLAIPRLGELMRCALLHRYDRVPVNKLLGTVVAERAIDIATILLLLLVVVMLEFERMSRFTYQFVVAPMEARLQKLSGQHLPYVLLWIGALAIAAVIAVQVYRRLSKTRLFIRIRYLVRGFVAGLRSVSQLRHLHLFLVYTVLIWLLYMLMSYVCFFCFPQTSHLSVIAGLAVMVFGGFGWAAPVQGGLGTFHLIVTQALVLYGIAEADGLAYAILSHGTQVAGMLVFGLLALVVLPWINRRRKGLSIPKP
ncbi:MAG: lysylphosphatidylglycerol synthase transmembrane domain-containing protein [Chitinophagales bacterium]|nr:flippase-like domain-containing protein [Chitinophagales bacterium]MDW8393859.1 lysylphosphatidylglycerol synthase transmembrane domain-containing protein [Chitinophagales bacterium]